MDALSVADSLDAATDNIGRCYNLAKPFRVLLEELRAQSGTRYAPNVVALFEDERFCQQLAENTDAERKRVYLQVYHAGSEENKRPSLSFASQCHLPKRERAYVSVIERVVLCLSQDEAFPVHPAGAVQPEEEREGSCRGRKAALYLLPVRAGGEGDLSGFPGAGLVQIDGHAKEPSGAHAVYPGKAGGP